MSTIKATTLSNLAGSKTVPTDTVVDGSAKAWVNFNGTGTVAIRRAFNVSSITDNGTGAYTVNFTTAMPDANYSATIAFQRPSTTGYADVLNVTTSSIGMRIQNSAGVGEDSALLSISIFS